MPGKLTFNHNYTKYIYKSITGVVKYATFFTLLHIALPIPALLTINAIFKIKDFRNLPCILVFLRE